jgi:DNA polymerase III delta prime subunit
MQYPPPHYLLFEPLNDKNTLDEWKIYKSNNQKSCEFMEIDAAEINSVDTFAPWFDNWITQLSSTRYRILLILHSDFLTFSCQQMLRRSLENRSFKCRVWFHVEDPTLIQSAIQSRCIIKRMNTHINKPIIKTI